MSLTYNIIFNSGQVSQFNYEEGADVASIMITNSDQSYYQTADLQLYDMLSTSVDTLDINNTLKVYINNTIEFDGYVNRIQTSIDGTKIHNIQAIGKTYNLWRFVTSSNVSYTNKYSSYIVSSLVHDYCSGNGFYVAPPDIGSTSGSFVDKVEFPNMEIGSCIGRMARLDGYTFYIGSDNKLNYYEPEVTTQFTVVESDIIEMSPYELSDDSMKNDVFVVGSVQYEKYSEATESPDGYFYISGTKVGGSDGKYISQKITVPDDLHADWLSSIKLYVDRSVGDNIPYYLRGRIRGDDTGEPSSNFYASSDSLRFVGTDVMTPPSWTPYYTYSSPESFPISGSQAIWLTFNYDGASESKYWRLAYSNFKNPSYGDKIDYDPNFTETWDYDSKEYGDVTYNSTDDIISFYASSIGYAAEATFDNDGSRRYRDFGITGGGITDDLMYFQVSTNINSYWSGNLVGVPKSDTYDKYNPRLMIGVYDPTSPGGNDYNPMIGFEFNLDTAENITQKQEQEAGGWIGMYDQTWTCQTFTTKVKQQITSISSKMSRVGTNPGTYTVSIRATSAGEPTGGDLTTGTLSPTTGVGYLDNDEWIKISVTPYTLQANTMYAIVGRCSSTDSSQYLRWSMKYANVYDNGEIGSSINGGSAWTMNASVDAAFKIYSKKFRRVRPFVSNDIIDSDPVNPQYRSGIWETTGANSYKCQLEGTDFLFYIDNILKQTWDISNVTLNGNYKFGAGNVYNWSGFRIQLIDSASGSAGDVWSFAGISGNISYLEVGGSADCLSLSTDSGQTWTNDLDKHLLYSIGWNYDNVKGTATDTTTISKYGTHFYKVSEDLLTTYVDSDNYAQRLVNTYKSGVSTGSLTINGRTDIDIKSKFRFSGTNIGLDKDLVITQYTNAIDRNGFTTNIVYGEAPYDIARKVASLEGEVYG